MQPDEAVEMIREACFRRPELLWNNWPNIEQRKVKLPNLMGFCYIATQVFWVLIPEAKPYSQDRLHFWAQIGDTVYDPTSCQFDYRYPYHMGNKTRFPRLTTRAQELLKEVMDGDSYKERVA